LWRMLWKKSFLSFWAILSGRWTGDLRFNAAGCVRPTRLARVTL
jgi:hypothetical protein